MKREGLSKAIANTSPEEAARNLQARGLDLERYERETRQHARRMAGEHAPFIVDLNIYELLETATEFRFFYCTEYEWEITVRKRFQPDGSHLWGVYFGDRRVWDKKAGQFIHEGGDALDSKKHLRRCRFKTLKEAWEQAGLGLKARRAQEAEWAAKRQETKAHIQRYNILEAARTGSSLAYQMAEDEHGIGFWGLIEQGACMVTVEEPDGTKKPKLALQTAHQVEHNAEVLRKAFVAKFGEFILR